MKQEAQFDQLVNSIWGGRRLPVRRQRERHLAQMGMGILIALKEAKMSVRQAEEDLFNLEVYQAAKQLRLDPAFIAVQDNSGIVV